MSNGLKKIKENAAKHTLQQKEIEDTKAEILRRAAPARQAEEAKWKAVLKERLHLENEEDVEGVLEVFMLGYDEGVLVGGLYGVGVGIDKVTGVVKKSEEPAIYTGPKLTL